ncbi:helix-turn-helix domain-containing protein [Paenibacillus terreus]
MSPFRSHSIRNSNRAENTVGIGITKRERVSSIKKDQSAATPGERIRQARIEMDMTIRELASRVSMTPEGLGMIERNIHPPSLPILHELSKVLQRPISHLGCYENMPETTIGDKIKKARHYHGLTKLELSKLIKVNEKTVRNWESNRTRISDEYMSLLKEYLEVLQF